VALRGPFADAQGDKKRELRATRKGSSRSQEKGAQDHGVGVILREAKDLRDPSALRPQGDRKVKGLRT